MSIDFTNYFVVLCRVSWIFWILFLAKPLAGTLHKTLYISRWGRINPRCHFHYIVNKPLISSLYRLSSFSRLLLLSAIRYPSIFSFDKIHKNPSSKWFTIFLNFFSDRSLFIAFLFFWQPTFKSILRKYLLVSTVFFWFNIYNPVCKSTIYLPSKTQNNIFDIYFWLWYILCVTIEHVKNRWRRNRLFYAPTENRAVAEIPVADETRKWAPEGNVNSFGPLAKTTGFRYKAANVFNIWLRWPVVAGKQGGNADQSICPYNRTDAFLYSKIKELITWHKNYWWEMRPLPSGQFAPA